MHFRQIRFFIFAIVLVFAFALPANPSFASDNSQAIGWNKGVGYAQGIGNVNAPYQTYNGRHPTNEEREAAGLAAKVARAQAAANNLAPKSAGAVGVNAVPDYFGPYGNFAMSPLPSIDVNGNVIAGTGMRKFVDGLPGLGPTAANDLGQYVSLAHPDTITYPGSDYYELAVVEYTEKMHADLPPTTLRGYVQMNYGTNTTSNLNTIPPDPVHYLGATIVATSNRSVRIKLTNLLPTTTSGFDLFLPTDTTVMGAGTGPAGGTEMYPNNRATIHLHGGLTPWVSDGTPHQWVAPLLQSGISTANYTSGASLKDVPDMPVSPGGSVTFYYTNQQSARLMFYHDHALGITRLNVYDGVAAGYVLTDATEQAMIAAGTLPSIGIPLVIQDRTFVPQTTQLLMQDPTWDTVNWGGFGSLWFPHVYMPNQNPFDPAGVTAMGRWDYGPWFGIPGILNGPVANPYYVPGGTEPPLIPGVPNVSQVGETFLDTPIVNGTAYPTVTLQPQAYRFRILDAANDRIFNLSLFQAAPLTIGVTTPGSGYTSVPAVQISGGSAIGASAAASLGVVNAIVTAGGSGYTTPPNVTISGGGGVGASAAAIMTGTSVSSILILTQGNGYTSVPTISIGAPPAGGVQATAAASLGVVKISMVNRGTASSGAIVNPTVTITGGGGTGAAAIGSVLSDVSMVAATATPGIPFPASWVQATDGPNVLSDILDGRQGGVPDPTYMGPSWIVIGNEGGFLPQPAVIDPSPIGYQHNNKNSTWNNVSKKSLFIAPAERSDVIVDFSAFAGQTLILYNDAPAPTPMFDVRNDYYTGDPDQTQFGGAPTTLPGYGPNTRTIMQIRIAAATPVPFNSAALNTAIPAAYGASQDPPIVPESVYNQAFGTTYSDDYVRILDAEFSPAATGQSVASIVVSFRGIGFITAVPSVMFNGGGGTGAAAAASMLPQGAINNIVIGNAGSGYTSAPTVAFSGGGGGGATAQAVVMAGQLIRVDVINPGSGYTTPPNVTLTGGGGTGAQAAADIGTAFLITSPGSNYDLVPTVALTGGGGTGATANAYLGIGSVTLNITGNYPSYTTPPTITVTANGTGSGALLVPVMALNPLPGALGGGFTVAGVTIVSPGGGYTNNPIITFSGGGAGAVQATATATLGVGGINVVSAGSGYTTAPTVTITGGGLGTGATAVAINPQLNTGLIGAINITAAGSGYTTAPQITFIGGGGAANTATAYATLTGTTTYHLQQKDVVAGFERYYGRLSMQQGSNAIPYFYIDPVTEFWQADGTQIWRISHIGVDTHPLHWHLFDLQIINRIQIDGVINPPDPEEQGWKETVRINPFESLVVAAKPKSPLTPFGLPDSIRPLSPAEPIGATMGFTNLLPGGGVTAITNQVTNFGFEYVWHCHILSHEENDMMRPVTFAVTTIVPNAPTGLAVTTAGGNTLTWTDPTPAATSMGNSRNEVGFNILRANGPSGGTFTTIATVPANTTSFIDGTVTGGNTYRYEVNAFNNKGNGPNSNTVTATSSVLIALPAVPTLTSPAPGANATTAAPIPFAWSAVAGATSYELEVLSGATVVVRMPGLIAPDINLPNGVLHTGSYTWRVSATNHRGTSAFSTASALTVTGVPAVPVLISPANGGRVVSTSITTFTWGAAAGATTYGLQIFAGATPVLNVTGIAATTYNVPASTFATGTYTWQVNATNAIGTSAFSAPFSFVVPPQSKIGIYRPSAGLWAIDANGNGTWDGTGGGDKTFSFGISTDKPVTGDWNGDNITEIGIYRPSAGLWVIDFNGNGTFDGTGVGGDKTFLFGLSTDIPVTGDWNGDGITDIGIYRPSAGLWVIDFNGNGTFNGTGVGGDKTFLFGISTDIPVTGDWNGNGTTDIGIYRPSAGLWVIDFNGNGTFNGTGVGGDKTFSFGISTDKPVTGDWNAGNVTEIGIFRPSAGLWAIDFNGNGTFDGTGVGGDRAIPFGVNTDIPVTGKW